MKDSDPGPVIAAFRGRQINGRDWLTLFLPGILAVLAPAGYGLWKAYQAYTRYGPAAADQWSRPWYGLALAALLCFGLALVFRLRQARRRVSIHKQGLQVGHSRQQFLPWRSLKGVSTSITRLTFLGLPLGMRYSAVLYPSTGRPVRLTQSIQGLPELISRIKASLYPRLLPHLRVEFDSGSWLNFGPVSIHTTALRLRSRQFPWTAVRRLTVNAGDLVIEFEGKHPERLPASQVPNLELLLQLVQEADRSAGEANSYA